MTFEVIFDLDNLEREISELEKEMAKADFWQRNQEEISKLNQERSFLSESIDQWKRLSGGA